MPQILLEAHESATDYRWQIAMSTLEVGKCPNGCDHALRVLCAFVMLNEVKHLAGKRNQRV
jgi:hypothetical protein